MNSAIPVQTQNRFNRGDSVTADWANQTNDSIRRLAARIGVGNPFSENTIPPLHVMLGAETDGTYFVTVWPGYVIEILATVTTGDALAYHEVPNTKESDGSAKKHAIASGQAIFVHVTEGPNGNITDVDLEVATKTQASNNFVPPSPDGEYYFKLAELDTGATPMLKMFAGGSHIYKRSGLTCDFRITDCAEEPAQLIRISFLSGVVASIGQLPGDRPLSENIEEATFTPCSGLAPP
jgi:hypothetical protein